ncbi:MAG: MFS transporter [Anaerolineae bacterium]|nr:MFS transporter [Anaerolineae bacterium]
MNFKKAFRVILFTAFINFVGIGIITPILPQLLKPFVSDAYSAFVGALLLTVFSVCQLIAAPILGVLSDRYGRRPVLLISLAGSMIGYMMFGIGGSLMVLFVSRMIDGFTGGNISTLYAYVADAAPFEKRVRYYGWLGAACGIGFTFGPLLGSAIYGLSGRYDLPLYLVAGLTLINVIACYYWMPESLLKPILIGKIYWAKFHPFAQLRQVMKIPHLRVLMLNNFLWMSVYTVLQANLNFLTQDRFGWQSDTIGLVFALFGIAVIITQGGLMPQLVSAFNVIRIHLLGLMMIGAGFLLIVVTSISLLVPLVFVSTVIIAIGLGLVIPTFNELLAESAPSGEQGRLQGASQAMQALARILAPLWAGVTYVSIGYLTPYLFCVLLIGIAIGLMLPLTQERTQPSEI